jgi:indole-3-glycerol phosphate synthase
LTIVEPMTFLEEILGHKLIEIAGLNEAELRRKSLDTPAPRPFLPAWPHSNDNDAGARRVRLIAELKRASPSRGLLAPHLDLRELAAIYAANGASAISVLTDARFFLGSLDTLRTLRSAATPPPPLLRKDFILSPAQLYETRAAGADAVLLITAALRDDDPGNDGTALPDADPDEDASPPRLYANAHNATATHAMDPGVHAAALHDVDRHGDAAAPYDADPSDDVGASPDVDRHRDAPASHDADPGRDAAVPRLPTMDRIGAALHATARAASLRDLHALALDLGLTPLVEVHSLPELERVLRLPGLQWVGINNRDLHTFKVTLETTATLRPHVPPGVGVVSESGIFTAGDVQRLAAAGVDAVLVGEALVTATDIGAKVRELSAVLRAA